MVLLLRCLHNAEEMKVFDRPRQTLLCSIITDCGGELSWFCQLAAPTVWWLLWGLQTQSQSPRHSSELGVVTIDWCIKTKEIMCTNHLLLRTSRANALLVQGHTRDCSQKIKAPAVLRLCGPCMKLRMTCVLDDVERNQIM